MQLGGISFTEVYATDWILKVGTGYNTGSALVQLKKNYAIPCTLLLAVTHAADCIELLSLEPPVIQAWGSTGIYSLALTPVSGNYIIGTQGRLTLIWSKWIS